MTLTDLFLSQVTDVFRIGLLIALVATAMRTAQAVGRMLPLAAGLVFVAVLIPLSIAPPAGVGLAMAIGCGLAANAAILAVLLAAQALFQRFRG
jgi:hypothetical protein